MLIILRIIFGAALVHELVQAGRSVPSSHIAGDTTGAAYLVVCVILALLNAIVWAPYLGEKISSPLTGTITKSTYVERRNPVLRLIRWLDARDYRLPTVLLCFLEGVRHPKLPAAFVIGFKRARTGSWLEKIFAREVFRFSNTQHCIEAYLALKRHGIDPRPHHVQEVNVALLSVEREARLDPEDIPLPRDKEQPPLKRNPGIKLFRN
jgi:hypothetical protein